MISVVFWCSYVGGLQSCRASICRHRCQASETLPWYGKETGKTKRYTGCYVSTYSIRYTILYQYIFGIKIVSAFSFYLFLTYWLNFLIWWCNDIYVKHHLHNFGHATQLTYCLWYFLLIYLFFYVDLMLCLVAGMSILRNDHSSKTLKFNYVVWMILDMNLQCLYFRHIQIYHPCVGLDLRISRTCSRNGCENLKQDYGVYIW